MRALLTLALLVLLAAPASAARVIRYVGGQGAGFAGTTSNQTVTFALTNGMANQPEGGDLVIVTFCTGSVADRTLDIETTGAVNYTLIGNELYQNDTFDSNMRVAYRFMPATPETQFRFAGGTGHIDDSGRYTVHVFRGVDPDTPLDVAAQQTGGTDSRVVNPPSITPSTAGAWIMQMGCGAGATGGTYTASNLSDVRAGTTADTNDGFVGSGYYRQWTSGAFDPANFAGGGTTTTNDSWNSTVIALRPATLTTAIKPTGSIIGNRVNATTVALAFPTGETVTSGNSVLVGCATWWGAGGGETHAAGDLTKTAGTATVGSAVKDVEVTPIDCDGGGAMCNSTIFRIPITGTGTLTLTVLNNGAESLTCVAQEYSGFDATTPLQGSNTGSNTSGAPTTGTVAGTGEGLFFGALGIGTAAAITVTQGADFDSLYEMESGVTFMAGGHEERIVTSDTTDAADWTSPTTERWTAAVGFYQDTVAAAGPQFIWPSDGWITATDKYVYGANNGTGADIGIADIATPYWTPVVAARGGTVTAVERIAAWAFDSAAWIVRIDHESNYSTIYGHLIETPLVAVNQTVVAGQTIGYNGRSGTTSSHVHFGVLLNDVGVTPTGFTFGDWVTQGETVPGTFSPLSTISEVPGNWAVKTIIPQDAYATASAGGTVTCTLPRDSILQRADSSVGFWQVAACSTNVWIPYSSTSALPRGEAGIFGDTSPTISEAPVGGLAVQTFTSGLIQAARTNQAVDLLPLGYPVVARRLPVDALVTVHEFHPSGRALVTDPQLPVLIGTDAIGPFFGWADANKLVTTDSFMALPVAVANVRDAPSVSGNLVYQFDQAKPSPDYYSHFEVAAVVNGWYQIVAVGLSYDPPQRMPLLPPVFGPAWVEGWRVIRR